MLITPFRLTISIQRGWQALYIDKVVIWVKSKNQNLSCELKYLINIFEMRRRSKYNVDENCIVSIKCMM